MNKEAIFKRALEYYRNSLYCEAGELFDEIIKKNPRCEECYFYAGRCCENLFFESKAIEYYLKGIKFCLNNEYIADYHLDIGNCYIKLSKIDEAIFHYDEASKFEDNYMVAQFNKARAFVCINDYKSALSIFEFIRKNDDYDKINNNMLDEYVQYCERKLGGRRNQG